MTSRIDPVRPLPKSPPVMSSSQSDFGLEVLFQRVARIFKESPSSGGVIKEDGMLIGYANSTALTKVGFVVSIAAAIFGMVQKSFLRS